ncbi:MAG: hypothetical protein HQ498_04000, partial [Pseudohongiella sp.]|nr:hypothetical protein [Pseudohongiella sp.]
MDYYTRLIKPFFYGILLSIVFSILFAKSFAQSQLQGPFVPIGVESVHINGNQSDVSVLYHAKTTGGSDVYGSGVTPFTEQEAVAQAIKKSADPNGGGLAQQLSNDGFNVNAGGDGFDKDVDADPPGYDGVGNCGYPDDLPGCVAYARSYIDPSPTYQWYGIKCHDTQAGKVLMQQQNISTLSIGTWGIWVAPVGTVICQDSPSAPLPDPSDPTPPLGDMTNELAGSPPVNP